MHDYAPRSSSSTARCTWCSCSSTSAPPASGCTMCWTGTSPPRWAFTSSCPWRCSSPSSSGAALCPLRQSVLCPASPTTVPACLCTSFNSYAHTMASAQEGVPVLSRRHACGGLCSLSWNPFHCFIHRYWVALLREAIGRRAPMPANCGVFFGNTAAPRVAACNGASQAGRLQPEWDTPADMQRVTGAPPPTAAPYALCS